MRVRLRHNAFYSGIVCQSLRWEGCGTGLWSARTAVASGSQELKGGCPSDSVGKPKVNGRAVAKGVGHGGVEQISRK